MKKIPVLFIVFSLMMFSCIEEEFVTSGKFWAKNFSTDSYYRVDAQMLAENSLCRVWAEKGSGVSVMTAQYVASSYKNDIYNKMIDTFSFPFTDDNGNPVELNIIQLANLLTKGSKYDGKLTILIMDIKDGYQQGVNDSYIAGYFWAGNLYDANDVRYSNKCDMIYVDINPGIPGSMESNETLAHELQHLMNFVGSVIKREKLMDLWIDEGLSVTAEWVYRGEHTAQRLGYYNYDVSGLLAKGNNFFVWGNREKENQYAVLDDYSTVYLFFQWLRLQSDKEIYRKISMSKENDFNAVIDAFNETVSGSGDKYPASDWKSMLKDWLAANYFLNSAGRYGYGNDTVLNDIKTHYAPNSPTSLNLFPGEGVYSNVEGSYSIPTPVGNIKYAGLNGSTPVSSGSISTGALLTYNANTDSGGKAETGRITGVAPPVSSSMNISAPSGGRSITAVMGPFPISGNDVLRRKGIKDNFYPDGVNLKIVNLKIPDVYRGIKVNE